MKNLLGLLTFCLVALSCETSSDLVPGNKAIVGFWSRETVFLNGVNSLEYVDFLNGTNFLNIKNDNTFERAYDIGRWNLSYPTLMLDREGSSGISDWTYEIIAYSENNLVLEIRLTEGQYCCGFDAFSDNEIITIREFYKKLN